VQVQEKGFFCHSEQSEESNVLIINSLRFFAKAQNDKCTNKPIIPINNIEYSAMDDECGSSYEVVGGLSIIFLS
jgi:hypothetical protein